MFAKSWFLTCQKPELFFQIRSKETATHYITNPGKGEQIMAESMKDYETELEASFKKIEEGDILTGTVISVDEKEVVIDLKYYAEGIIPAEDYSREPGFSLKEEVHVGDEVSATVVRKDDGNGNILLSRVEAADVEAWDKLKELKVIRLPQQRKVNLH